MVLNMKELPIEEVAELRLEYIKRLRKQVTDLLAEVERLHKGIEQLLGHDGMLESLYSVLEGLRYPEDEMKKNLQPSWWPQV